MHLIETLSMKSFLYTHGQGESLINVCAGWFQKNLSLDDCQMHLY